MAEYKQNLKSINYVKYEEIIKLSKMIMDIMDAFAPESKYFSCSFECDHLSCVVDSIEELIENAYGAKRFRLINLSIIAKLSDDDSIAVEYEMGYRVSATSKVLLHKLLQEIDEKCNSDIRNSGEASPKMTDFIHAVFEGVTINAVWAGLVFIAIFLSGYFLVK